MPAILIHPDYSDKSGITIRYTKKHNMLHISGWYDSTEGIEGRDMTLGEFFHLMNITEKECVRAFTEDSLITKQKYESMKTYTDK